MHWFLIALINPLAYAFINHLDKYLINRFTKDSPVGVLILFSSLFAILALPVLFFLDSNVLSAVNFTQALILIVNGAVLTLAIMFYLYALETDEASYVVPFFQLIPIFGFIFGYLILGEVLHTSQWQAALLILVGALILSLELDEQRIRIKSKLVLLMLGSSFFYALNTVVFKFIAIEQGFVVSLFWDMLGKVLLGVILFLVVRSFRTQFIGLIRSHRYTVLGLNAVNEVIGLVAEITSMFAVLLAPVVLVQVVWGTQPMFVFLFGILFTIFSPRFSRESLLRHHLAQKIIGIIIITVGVFILELG